MAYPESAVEDPPHGEGIGWCGGCKQDLQQGAQKPIEPAQEQAEVVAGSGEHGVDAIAIVSGTSSSISTSTACIVMMHLLPTTRTSIILRAGFGIGARPRGRRCDRLNRCAFPPTDISSQNMNVLRLIHSFRWTKRARCRWTSRTASSLPSGSNNFQAVIRCLRFKLINARPISNRRNRFIVGLCPQLP